MTIDEMWEHYREDLNAAEKKIGETLKVVEPAVAQVGNHLLSSGGKRVRPFLAILSAKLFGAHGDEVSTLACSVEFIHSASLIHDDVVDGASIRRGGPSAHSVYGNQVVILVGDFLYANALRLANLLKRQSIMDALCTATAKMSEGELVQLSKTGSIDITEDDYMKIIRGKTAILISAACQGGAVLGNATKVQEDALAAFGLKFGYAFQMADDILDYVAVESRLGKKLGKDLEEGKITLPLINLLKEVGNEEKDEIKKIIQTDTLAETDLAYMNHLFKKYRSIEKSYEKAQSLLSEAKAELDILDDSIEKESLVALADYAVNRKK